MIALRHLASGEIQIVASADGYSEGWAIIADPAPADILTAPYLVQDGALLLDLATARAAQRAVINLARNAAQDSACQTPHGLFQCDPRSRDFLKGSLDAAERLAAKGLLTEVKWTLADDRDVLLTMPQLEEAGLAIAAHVAAMHARARVLKSRIDAAETLAEIAAVTWTLQD
jgi:hypothetical protein